MANASGSFFRTSPAGRRLLLGLCGLLVLVVGAISYFATVVTTQRASAIRLERATELRGVAQTMLMYQRDTGVMPSTAVLAARGEIPPIVAREFLAAQRTTVGAAPPSGKSPYLVQREPCRAVKQGEPWGGPGEFSDVDHPAIRFVLWSDGMVEEVEETTFERDLAPTIVLAPLP